MPDISDKEKYLIKLIAERYSRVLAHLKFNSGALIYQKTYERLFKKSARWKYCLLCGRIERSEFFKTKEHTCPPLIFQNHPICCSTSWIQLREFFLSNMYLDTLAEVGVEVIAG